MIADRRGVLGAQITGEGKMVEGPIVHECKLVIGVVPFISHVLAEVNVPRRRADQLHRAQDVQEVTVAFE